MEISSHIADGTHPPGVLFDGGTHGLEHLSVEMPLAIMGWLLDGYGHDQTITELVGTRAIFLVFDVNPDGAAFDISGGRFHEWRKNRQSSPNGVIGTDLNRNYDDHWGCCGRVSSKPTSSYYRGADPFSAPETQAVRDLVEGLVFDGRQEIRAAIAFHASGRLILWPYGYTKVDVPAGMPSTDHDTFVALATEMARLDGYRAEQASELYVDSGTARDWYYGAQGIFGFTFELATGTYQRSAVIATETERNRTAILYLVELAACPDRALDGAPTCPDPP
jgi:Zinc carboxypeptidase.